MICTDDKPSSQHTAYHIMGTCESSHAKQDTKKKKYLQAENNYLNLFKDYKFHH